jgi:hypothetical protein
VSPVIVYDIVSAGVAPAPLQLLDADAEIVASRRSRVRSSREVAGRAAGFLI